MTRTASLGAGGGFAKEVTHAISAVHAAFGDLLGQLPPAKRPVELSRTLGIDYTISRKAMRLAEARDPLSVAIEVPRPAAIGRILKAASRNGVSGDVLERLERAIEEYEDLAKRYAGDRATFDAMVGSLSPEAGERAHLEARRAAYRANTQLLGRQVDTSVFFLAIRPSQEQGYLEHIWVCANFGLKRFHPAASLEVLTTLARGPSEPMTGGGPYQSDRFLLRAFCSDPLPDLKPVPAFASEGLKRFELGSEEIGLRSAVDCVIGQYCHLPISEPNSEGQRLCGLQTSLDMPTAVCLMDLFVHESLGATAPPICFTTTNSLPSNQPIGNEPLDASMLLPVQPIAEAMGRGPRAAYTNEVPRYGQIIRHAFDVMNWSGPDRYRLTRCRIEYPILNTHTVLRIPI